MKKMKLFIASAIIASGFSTFAQNDEAQIKSIVDVFTAKCSGPTYGEDSVRTITNYSLYREFKKQGENKADSPEDQMKYYKDALTGWKYVMYHAPAWRETPIYDGMDIYRSFANNATDNAAKNAYIDTMLAFYDIHAHCFGESSENQFYKAFDWYTYKNNKGNEKFIYDQFNKTLKMYETDKETSVNDIDVSILVPWLYTAIKANKSKLIAEEEVFEVYDKVNSIIDANMAGENAGYYKAVSEQADNYMQQGGYLDPAKVSELATKKYNANPDDHATQIKVYNMLKSVKAYDDPIFIPIVKKLYAKEPSSAWAMFLAKDASKKGNHTEAISYMQDVMEYANDASEKANNYLTIAQLYQAKGDYSSARTYANKAADARPGWGEPYILIGNLYAASGSRCGSGTGWDSQVVTWAAIDMWTKAKNVDASVAGEAQAKINKYWQYMPSKEDIFLRPDVQVGGNYYVGCWIGVNTTVRTSD